MNFLERLFGKKKPKILWEGSGRTHEVFLTNPNSDNESDFYLCKNCEEYYRAERYTGKIDEQPHGEWKSISEHYKEFINKNNKQYKYKFIINGNYGSCGKYNENLIFYFFGYNYNHAKRKAENFIINHNKMNNDGDLFRYYTLK